MEGGKKCFYNALLGQFSLSDQKDSFSNCANQGLNHIIRDPTVLLLHIMYHPVIGLKAAIK